eukprot:m.4114 g.4114  ORF g.4114 m.4114 type:complete len:202 (+) comp3811_c1_seq1:110-715(+)
MSENRALVVMTTTSLPADVLYRRVRSRAAVLLTLALIFTITAGFWYAYMLVCAPIWTLAATLALRNAGDLPGVKMWMVVSSIMSLFALGTSIGTMVEFSRWYYDAYYYNDDNAIPVFWGLYITTCVVVLIQVIGCFVYLNAWKRSLSGTTVLVQHQHQYQAVGHQNPYQQAPNPYQQAPPPHNPYQQQTAPPPAYTQAQNK